MTDDFKPPIKSRTTEELLAIAGAPKKWNERALKLALDELYDRKVETSLIEEAKKAEKFLVEFESLIKADSRFEFFCLRPHRLFINWSEVFMFLFSWEYEKDGFLYKAEIQRKYRPIILMVILILIISSYFFLE
jgi:hypothetical protein